VDGPTWPPHSGDGSDEHFNNDFFGCDLAGIIDKAIYPGAPTVYCGGEVDVTGADEPMNRAPFPWADEGGQPDLKLLAVFKQLIKMRHNHQGRPEGGTLDGVNHCPEPVPAP
jgi:hypothetical protein